MQTTVTMPSVVVKPAKLYIETMIPASGMVRTTLPASYTIHNRTDSVLELEIVMDSSEAFMFSGHKQVSLLIRLNYRHMYKFKMEA